MDADRGYDPMTSGMSSGFEYESTAMSFERGSRRLRRSLQERGLWTSETKSRPASNSMDVEIRGKLAAQAFPLVPNESKPTQAIDLLLLCEPKVSVEEESRL